MALLTAGVILVGILSILNLLFTYGVVRRLREHTKLLSERGGTPGNVGNVMLPAGNQVGDFTARLADGEPFARSSLAGLTLVGFFSPGCDACTERLPSFVELAGSPEWSRDRVVAVVLGEEKDTAEIRERLEPVARLVASGDSKLVGMAFGVEGFPAFCVVDSSGVVLSSAYTVPDLQVPMPI